MTLYQVRNKVFCITYWNRAEADEFVSKQPASAGFEMCPLQVFGDMDEWLNDVKEVKRLRADLAIFTKDPPDNGFYGRACARLLLENVRLRAELAVFRDGMPQAVAIENAIESLKEHHDARDNLMIGWLRRIAEKVGE